MFVSYLLKKGDRHVKYRVTYLQVVTLLDGTKLETFLCSAIKMKSTSEDSCSSSDFFSPPLWRQRRTFIQDVLNQHSIETVGSSFKCTSNSVAYTLLSGY